MVGGDRRGGEGGGVWGGGVNWQDQRVTIPASWGITGFVRINCRLCQLKLVAVPVDRGASVEELRVNVQLEFGSRCLDNRFVVTVGASNRETCNL